MASELTEKQGVILEGQEVMLGDQDVIAEGEQIILKKEKVLKVFQVRKNRTVFFERTKFVLDDVIGRPWGSTFEVTAGKSVYLPKGLSSGDAETDMPVKKDNRNLVDDSENQKLTREDIHSMKDQGATGQEVVENLIENSATFSKKTEFAQQKYIKKKKNKHMSTFTVLKPSTRLLAKMYYSRGPSKICNLRLDSLAQLLTYSNIHAGCKVMVVENVVGLLLGAVMDRMQGKGDIMQFYNGTAPVRQALENFNFPKEHYKILQAYPLNQMCDLKRRRNGLPVVESVKTESDSKVKVLKSETEANEAQSETKTDENEAKTEIKMEENETKTEATTEAEPESMDQQEESENPTCSDADNNGANVDTVEDENEETKLGNGEKRKTIDEERERKQESKQAALETARALLLERKMDALVMAVRCHPTPIVLELIDYLLPSRPFAIYCQFKEPLLDCYMQLRDHGGVFSLRLSETWLRNYQVLPNRTHSEINMSGTGGYLLTGMTVKQKF